jgi:hypothetical protein
MNKIEIGKYIEIQKATDFMFEGDHPNGVNVGMVLSGYVRELPKVGEQFRLWYDGIDICKAWTSIVEELDLEEGTIITKNSLYKVLDEHI